MAYDIQLNLPADWQKESDTYQDESGAIVTHFEAHLYDVKDGRDKGVIDIYAGDMPEDTTAEDQALSNYADIVGFDDDDPEDFNPIASFKFNGRNAYGFEALCEDDSPMMFISQEPRKGVLVIMCVVASDDASLKENLQLVERNLRVR